MRVARDTMMSIVSEIGVDLPGAEGGRAASVTREERAGRRSRTSAKKKGRREREEKEECQAVYRELDQSSSRETDGGGRETSDSGTSPGSEEGKEVETPISQRRHGGLRLRDKSARSMPSVAMKGLSCVGLVAGG